MTQPFVVTQITVSSIVLINRIYSEMLQYWLLITWEKEEHALFFVNIIDNTDPYMYRCDTI